MQPANPDADRDHPHHAEHFGQQRADQQPDIEFGEREADAEDRAIQHRDQHGADHHRFGIGQQSVAGDQRRRRIHQKIADRQPCAGRDRLPRLRTVEIALALDLKQRGHALHGGRSGFWGFHHHRRCTVGIRDRPASPAPARNCDDRCRSRLVTSRASAQSSAESCSSAGGARHCASDRPARGRRRAWCDRR